MSRILYQSAFASRFQWCILFLICQTTTAEESFHPRNFIYTDSTTNSTFPCATGTNISFNATTKTDCCLVCLTYGQMNCLAGNFYPADGKCEIFEVWSDASVANPNCTSFRKIGICPPGFTYLPAVKTCLMLLKQTYTWEGGLKACSNLGPTAYMVSVDTTNKATNITKFLNLVGASKSCSNSADTCLIWTGGSTNKLSPTSSNYYWFGPSNLTTLLGNVPWSLGEPSIVGCLAMSIRSNAGYLYSTSCSIVRCVVCETYPDI